MAPDAALRQWHITMTSSESNLPSNLSFGALFVVFFGAVGGYQWLHGNMNGRLWLGAAILMLAVTLLKPKWLTPLNRAWMALADLLHRLFSPIALGLLYFGLFTPTGYAMRVFGRDVLNRRFDPSAGSYWAERSPPGPDVGGLADQF
ncbi:hypothetical protein [Roseateles sp. P5_E4]